jgi:hypothetical protein
MLTSYEWTMLFVEECSALMSRMRRQRNAETASKRLFMDSGIYEGQESMGNHANMITQ